MSCSDQPFEAGIFLIDKPIGPTSFAMVSRVRRQLKIKKVGHAGTLDPFASGLLILCAGRPATRMISGIMEGTKEYLATLSLGIETTTLDPEGDIVSRQPVSPLSPAQIEACLAGFRGEQQQVPPMYSALKHKGKPLYTYARRGVEIERAPRLVMIEALERTGPETELSGTGAELTIRVVCSKGTYIRTLAADIGRTLGCGAYLTALRRTRSGFFSVDQALSGDDLLLPDGRERLLAGALSVADVGNLLQ
ncbi:MAG: tRNA pseudouridine(55) synthase TruB [Desulfobulbaceae bacterium]|uniref:tRNA pseudouridine synthase B n=1 Tax=Candidatus Desulfatifera sulfidica TaxID=2841691 RepID=A0A8J6NAZ7_9BACT|nr:tRNA pseudouridine(55) synthase TruB [Candidatus Desulfatifera sulfidica]